MDYIRAPIEYHTVCCDKLFSSKGFYEAMVSSYIAQYPILRTAQSAFTLLPGRPVQSSTISASLGGIQPYATINARRLLVHISTIAYSQVHMYSIYAINARSLFLHKYTPLSIAMYSFVQLSELEQCRVKNMPKV